ncbi:MAG: peptidylprolyl isomerase, partial [Ensifer adhaerens]
MSKLKTLAAAALVAAIAVHGVARAEDADPVIATVGGEEVRQSELNLALGGLDPQLQQMPEEQKRAAALSAVIDVKLLSKTAEKEGLQDDATFK